MSNEKSFVFNFVKVKWCAAIRIIQRSARVKSQRYIIVAFVFRACRIAIYGRIMGVGEGRGESITSRTEYVIPSFQKFFFLPFLDAPYLMGVLLRQFTINTLRCTEKCEL